MDKKFYIRGFRENASYPTLYDSEPYPLTDAIDKAKEYFEKLSVISKIVLFEQPNGHEHPGTIILTKKIAMNADSGGRPNSK